MSSNEQKILEKIQEARESYINKDWNQAIRSYKWIEEQIKDDPVNLPIIWIELGWSYYNLKDFENCILSLEKALNGNLLNVRQKFDCQRLIGFSYAFAGNNKNAIKLLTMAIKQKISDEEKKYAYFKLGEILFIEGAIKKSKEHLIKVEKYFSWKETDYKKVLEYYLGFIAFYEKRFKDAENHFTKIIDHASNNKDKASGYFGIAHILQQRKNYKESVNICKKILELDKDFYDQETLGFFFCKSFSELKQYKEFAIFFTELREKYPKGRYNSYYPIFEKTLLKIKNIE